MHFPSIFRVNGEAVVARVDNKRLTTSINTALRTRLGLTDGQSVLVSVPIGSATHTCSTVIFAGEHPEDIILGAAWLRQFSTEAFQNRPAREGERLHPYGITGRWIATGPNQEHGIGLQFTSGQSISQIVHAGSSRTENDIVWLPLPRSSATESGVLEQQGPVPPCRSSAAYESTVAGESSSSATWS